MLLISTVSTEQLAILSLDITHISFIGIYLSSIDHFGPMNLVYRRYFGTSPPARACVAVDLPKPLRIRLDCVAFRNASPVSRKALHVQGLSYWAPANIGPYSQAVVVCCVYAYVAPSAYSFA
jgi:diphthine-ammonia ligase